jgi:hypothetical protein
MEMYLEVRVAIVPNSAPTFTDWWFSGICGGSGGCNNYEFDIGENFSSSFEGNSVGSSGIHHFTGTTTTMHTYGYRLTGNALDGGGNVAYEDCWYTDGVQNGCLSGSGAPNTTGTLGQRMMFLMWNTASDCTSTCETDWVYVRQWSCANWNSGGNGSQTNTGFLNCNAGTISSNP